MTSFKTTAMLLPLVALMDCVQGEPGGPGIYSSRQSPC